MSHPVTATFGVFLTTDLPPDALRPKRIRRRRCLGYGQRIRVRLSALGERDVPTLFIDGVPVARMAYPESGEWHGLDDKSWGNGLDIRQEFDL